MDEIRKNREAFANRMTKAKPKPAPAKPVIEKQPKKGKQARDWGVGKLSEATQYDYSKDKQKFAENGLPSENIETKKYLEEQRDFVGTMKGELQAIDAEEIESDEESDENEQRFSFFFSLN